MMYDKKQANKKQKHDKIQEENELLQQEVINWVILFSNQISKYEMQRMQKKELDEQLKEHNRRILEIQVS